MRSRFAVCAMGLLLTAGLPAGAQVTRGILFVNNTHMA